MRSPSVGNQVTVEPVPDDPLPARLCVLSAWPWLALGLLRVDTLPARLCVLSAWPWLALGLLRVDPLPADGSAA
jgi:hypothetical protein